MTARELQCRPPRGFIGQEVTKMVAVVARVKSRVVGSTSGSAKLLHGTIANVKRQLCSSTPPQPPLPSAQLLPPCFSSAPPLLPLGEQLLAPSPVAPSPPALSAVSSAGRAIVRCTSDTIAGDANVNKSSETVNASSTPSVVDGYKKINGMCDTCRPLDSALPSSTPATMPRREHKINC